MVSGEEEPKARQVGVIRGDEGHVEGAGQQPGDEADRAGRRGVDDIDALGLAPAQRLEDRQQREGEALVHVERVGLDRREDLATGQRRALGAGRDQRERPLVVAGVVDEGAQHRADAVDLLEGVGEHRHAGQRSRRRGGHQPLGGELGSRRRGVPALACMESCCEQVGGKQVLGVEYPAQPLLVGDQGGKVE